MLTQPETLRINISREAWLSKTEKVKKDILKKVIANLFNQTLSGLKEDQVPFVNLGYYEKNKYIESVNQFLEGIDKKLPSVDEGDALVFYLEETGLIGSYSFNELSRNSHTSVNNLTYLCSVSFS